MSSSRRKGPIGGLIGALGTGVGAVAEYREHRKEQKLSRESSKQEGDARINASTNEPQSSVRAVQAPTDLPPGYSEVVREPSNRPDQTTKPSYPDEKKAALAQYDERSSSSNSSDEDDLDSIEDDEEDWELDELGRADSPGLPSYEQSEQLYGNTDQLVQDVMSRRAQVPLIPTEQAFVRTALPYPVVIPQRRPRNKTRGFVRAYAPLLGECSGIDQETFLSFLENFHKSSQASPVFGVIQLAAGIAGLAPEPITMAVTTAVQIGARVGGELQSRHRTNDFLDKMNEQLFKPAGLFAMIVKYKSDEEVKASGDSLLARFGVASETVDFNTNKTIAKYDRTLSGASTGSGGVTAKMQNMRLASGTTKGSINLPAAAPLVFPNVDKALAKYGLETFKDKAKDAQSFLADYMDRRAQLKYARDDPNSKLALPESERAFKSKLADPEHPMYNSGPIGFLSGGYLAKDRTERDMKRDMKRERKDMKRESRDMERDMQREERDMHRYSRDMKRESRYERRQGRYERRQRRQMKRFEKHMDSGKDGEMYSSTKLGANAGFRDGVRMGGPFGLLFGAAGAAAGAVDGHRQRSREFEDSYGNQPVPPAAHGGAPAPPADYGRRSFDERSGAYDQRPGRESRRGGRGRRRGKRGGGPIGAVKRIMREDVLYLMIVNMPSEAEMAEARDLLESAKQGR